MSSNRYPTALSDAEWSLLEPHLPVPKPRGCPRVHSPREILNAVFYVLKTGCQWRLLPREFPPWKTVFHYFRTWRIDGTWERMNRAMRRRLREALGREPELGADPFVAGAVTSVAGRGGSSRITIAAAATADWLGPRRRGAALRGDGKWIGSASPIPVRGSSRPG
jgi:transposase